MGNKIKNYVLKQKKKGFSDADIIKAMKKVGYTKEEIKDGFGVSEEKVGLKPGKFKISKNFIIIIIVLVVLGVGSYFLVGQFGKETREPVEMSQPQFIGNFERYLLSQKEFYRTKDDPIVLKLKACANDCSYFSEGERVSECEKLSEEYNLQPVTGGVEGCEALKPTTFENYYICVRREDDNCDIGFETYMRAVSLFGFKKQIKNTPPYACELIGIPEIENICLDDEKTVRDLNNLRYGRVTIS